LKIRLTVLSLLAAGALFAQQQEAPPIGPLSNSNPITLATEFFEKNNFINYYAFANAVYDTYNPTLDSNGQRSNSGGVGYQVGGGISARHLWQKSVLTVNYSGDYRDYTSSFFGSGTDQNLGIGYSRKLAKRWNLDVGVGAGTILYGTGYFGQQSIGSGNLQLNPFSNSTRFFSSYVNLTYQQTRRLSYTMSGGFYLQRYSFPTAVGSTGGSGGFAVNYRVTSRTTISANYGRSYFVFQRGAGTSGVDSYYGSISHRFAHNWIASASGGISRSHVTGFVVSPLTIGTGDGTTLNGFVVGPYDSVSFLPSFSGAVTRLLKHSSFSVSGGQNVVSGNGYYLASKNQYLNGFYSRTYLRSNISIGGYWNRLNSVANTVAFAYTTTGFSGSYSYMVRKYIGVNARYDFLRYGALQPNPAIADNRFSFGVTFTSANVPLALY
jgi:hypothetical protein